MVEESRIAIYDYLNSVFAGVTQNIYSMRVPTENTSDDTANGFIVTEVSGVVDESEFDLQTYGQVRCFVTAYVPQKTRGRLDKTKYAAFENGINAAIRTEINTPSSSVYSIQGDGILSMDDNEDTQKGNQYNVYVKSFIVTINSETSSNTNNDNNND